MDITQYTDLSLIKPLESREKYAAIRELAQGFDRPDICDDIAALTDALIEREEIMSTGIGFKMAVPHARIRNVKKITFALGTSRQGIDFAAMDDKPVHLVILVAAGDMQHREYLRLLSRIMTLFKKESFKSTVINCQSAEEIFHLLQTNHIFSS